MRPIDADAFRENIQRYMSSNWVMPCDEILKRIDNAPTIEPEKVKESELIKAYTKGFDTGVETERQQGEEYLCKTCKYRFNAFDGHPCVNCRRNFKLVDEIREQKNDLWKDGRL